ncbi:MAG: hypothetical protein ABI480_02685 [Chitinophagaceae bacterium]
MNSNRRVLLFITLSVGIFLLASVAVYFYKVSWLPFNRVNLVSDVITTPPEPVKKIKDIKEDTVIAPIIVEEKPKEDFTLYQKPGFITDFSTDTNRSALENFAKKLYDLKTGKKRKIRVAYFGDSMIEGDLLTQTLRKLLQQTFGGDGVGFVPITSQVSKFRESAIADYSDGWDEDNFMQGKNRKLYLSGHSFHTSNAWVQIRDQTIHDDSAIIEKSLLCGPVKKSVALTVNNKTISFSPDKPLNRIVMARDYTRRIKLALADNQLPVYGVTFESDSGIFVDNFSFRGITGIEFAKVDSAFLHAIPDDNPYDLIVFQYGVNLMFRPNDQDFHWYSEMMLPVIRKMRNCFPESDFIVVSTTDRAFRYNGEYKSAIGIDSLIKIQALLAYETNSSFYNQFATMGGPNSIVDWAETKPTKARKDYVHPNPRGAELLANYFYAAIINDYKKYEQSVK